MDNLSTKNTKCSKCGHPRKLHKDICDSRGVRDGKHIHCLAPAKNQNDFLVKSFGGILTCSCSGDKK